MGEAENMNDALTNMHIRNKNEAPGAAGGNPAGNDGKAINISNEEDNEGVDSRDKENAVSPSSNNALQ